MPYFLYMVSHTIDNQKGEFMSTQVATLAGGCFWCLEAVYDEVKGVKSVESGYAGGNVDNARYKEV